MGHGLCVVCAPTSTILASYPYPHSHTSLQTHTPGSPTSLIPGLLSVQPYTEDQGRCRMFFYSADFHRASSPR